VLSALYPPEFCLLFNSILQTLKYPLGDGSVVSGINTGVFDGETGEVIEFTTFTAKDNIAGDFGRIIVSGAFDLAAGIGHSDYRGHICF
jgi:hypothetical protein